MDVEQLGTFYNAFTAALPEILQKHEKGYKGNAV